MHNHLKNRIPTKYAKFTESAVEDDNVVIDIDSQQVMVIKNFADHQHDDAATQNGKEKTPKTSFRDKLEPNIFLPSQREFSK